MPPNPAFNRTRRYVAATSVTVGAARRLTSYRWASRPAASSIGNRVSAFNVE